MRLQHVLSGYNRCSWRLQGYSLCRFPLGARPVLFSERMLRMTKPLLSLLFACLSTTYLSAQAQAPPRIEFSTTQPLVCIGPNGDGILSGTFRNYYTLLVVPWSVSCSELPDGAKLATSGYLDPGSTGRMANRGEVIRRFRITSTDASIDTVRLNVMTAGEPVLPINDQYWAETVYVAEEAPGGGWFPAQGCWYLWVGGHQVPVCDLPPGREYGIYFNLSVTTAYRSFTSTSLVPASFEAHLSLGAIKYKPVPMPISIISGNGQTSPTSVLPQPLTVGVGPGVSGVPVTFSISQTPTGANGASLSTSSLITTTIVSTNGSGTASVPLVLGDKMGEYHVTAACETCSPSSVTFTEGITCESLWKHRDPQRNVDPVIINIIPAYGLIPATIGGMTSCNACRITAGFSPNFGLTLADAAKICEVTGFNWQQSIDVLPVPTDISACSTRPEMCFFSRADPTKPLTRIDLDPVKTGYTYDLKGYFDDAFPFYFGPTVLGRYLTTNVLRFEDSPAMLVLNPVWQSAFHFTPTAQYAVFTTSLVGVFGADQSPPSKRLFQWTWKSNFNGTSGFVSKTSNLDGIDAGSGTGGITITSVDGVTLSPQSSTAIETTSSGLAYSRVSGTFNGTVTIRNVSAEAISGPFQIVFMSLPANVTVANATRSFYGNPVITVPGVATLAPGYSSTVSVQFRNPSNATISFTPVIYSGSLN